MIGIWSTNYSEITGQGLVTRRVAEHVFPHFGETKEYIFLASGRPKAIMSWLFAWLGLWRDIFAGRVTTLYVVCSRSNFGFLRDLPALLSARTGVRVVVHSHGSDIVELLSERKISRLARYTYSACELIVPSRHLVTPLKNFVSTVVVCEGFFSGMASLAPPQKTYHCCLRVLWNSNIMSTKGFFDLTAAIEQLHAEGLNVELISLGTPIGDSEMTYGTTVQLFKEVIKKPWMKYLGRVSNDIAVGVLREVDVVALPSRAESQGIAIVEGMCAGRAIVASEIPALRETLRHYPAEFVAPRSVDDISIALRRLNDEKAAGHVAFYERRLHSAAEARERFSTLRFDRELFEYLNESDTS